jgi:hypothetical protein
MSERRSACGSAESRRQLHGAAVWAAGCALCCLCACSGATDVVGVIDPDVTDVELTTPGSSADPANSAGFAGISRNASDGSELLVVAGLPLRDYPGLTFAWPLSARLRDFFSEVSWGRSGPPDHVEREAFERMSPYYSEQRKEDVRFVAPSADAAERLLGLFSAARGVFGSEPRSLVTRDGWSDEYLVVLGTASCDHSPNHHGPPCADPDGFTDGSPNDGNSSGADSSGANLDAP